jgi:hypothetical protein
LQQKMGRMQQKSIKCWVVFQSEILAGTTIGNKKSQVNKHGVNKRRGNNEENKRG